MSERLSSSWDPPVLENPEELGLRQEWTLMLRIPTLNGGTVTRYFLD